MRVRGILAELNEKLVDVETLDFQNPPTGSILNLNLYAISLLVQDSGFRHAFKGAKHIHVDGIGASVVIWVVLKRWFKPRGYLDWGDQVYSGDRKANFIIIGGTEHENDNALLFWRQKYPHHTFVGLNGYQDEFIYLNKMQHEQFDIALVGLGMPRQESLISMLINVSPETSFFACGGWIKQVAGLERNVPRVFHSLGLGWAFRSLFRRGHFRERVLLPLVTVVRFF